uniref:Uncharacterized protein n=1 Tax=Ciona intestinalis TaxID=7719 RepID=F6TV83_CIOIN
MHVTVKIYNPSLSNRFGSTNIQRFLENSTFLEYDESPSTTFDTILHKCAVQCKINPTYLNLFALRDSNTGYWVKFRSRLDEHRHSVGLDRNSTTDLLDANSDIKLEFRIRFTFKSDSQIDGISCQAHRYSAHSEALKPVMSDQVIEYLFYQCRDDFLNSSEKDTAEMSDPLGASLGVAVLDMLRLAREMDCDLSCIKSQVSFKKLLPRACRANLSKMNFCNRYRVERRFMYYLRHFSPVCRTWLASQCSPAYFYSKYIRNLELIAGLKSMNLENYDLLPRSSTNEDCDKITVGADCGIVKYSSASDYQSVNKWCDFKELTDMNLQVRQNSEAETTCIVKLSKLDGTDCNLSFKSVVEAENLASCIDGYYRLHVDPHHYLCKDVCSPSLVEHLALNCHGPITCSFSEMIINQQADLQTGDCLLRRSQDSYDEYFINTVINTNPDVIVKNYKLDRVNGLLGMFGDNASHRYQNLSALLNACRGNQHDGQEIPFNVDRIILPKSKQKTNLLIIRCMDASNQGQPMEFNLLSSPQTLVLKERDYTFHQHLGSGRFTDVNLHVHRNNPDLKIVLKQVFDMNQRHDLGQKQVIDESFQESISLLICLKNVHIVKQMGTMGTQIGLEYAPFRSITNYLQLAGNEQGPWGSWFLYALWQLTHACNYLEEMGCAHGNIRGRNVLLCQASPQPFVKLGDPGVRTCLGRNRVSEPVLPAPWLAYEFCRIDSEPLSSFPTIDGDKWSYATTVCEICCWGVSPEPFNAYSLSAEMKEKYRTASVIPIPEIIAANGVGELGALLRQCWNPYPPKRPPFKQILRELGTVLSSDYILPSVSPSNGNSRGESRNITNIIGASMPDLRKYRDDNLTFVKQLGEGHFGHVDLYHHDIQRNGQFERVAIKSLRRSMNNPQSRSDFRNEIETMRRIDHKYIVKLNGVAEPSLRIVMEYLPYGSLSHFLRGQRDSGIALQQLSGLLLRFSFQIAQGMLYLQEKRVIHRDLALRNILLDKEGSNCWNIKISDFGLSRILSEDRDYYTGNPDEFPAQWYAPECLRLDGRRTFHFESDVWSYGVTLWEMFSYGARPTYEPLPNITLRQLTQLQELLKDNVRLSQPEHCPNEVFHLISRCWEYEPQQRVKFDELCREFDRLRNE